MTLDFTVTGARPVRHAAEPTMALQLRISSDPPRAVQSVLLHAMIRITPEQRRYGAVEQERLVELFGDPHRWADTAKPFLWRNVTTSIGAFETTTEIDLEVPCSYDLEVAAGKYFHALDDGHIPLLLLFSGTVFTRGAHGLVAEPVPWDREARFGLPVASWRELMDAYFPGSGWVRLRRETIDAVADHKSRRGLPTWDAAISDLLARREVEA